MRHVIIEEPYSEAALWSRRLAVFGLAVACIGLILARTGLEPSAVLAVVGSAVLIACFAILCASAAFISIWQTGRKGVGLGLVGLLLGSLLLVYPAFLAKQAISLPPLSDVSTDVDDPPAFSLSHQALAARHGFAPPYVTAAARVLQENRYPDIQPVTLDVEMDQAEKMVRKAITAQHWTIIEKNGPSRRSGQVHFDAIARSSVLNLPNDITIRLRPLAGQTRVDVRSASRIGRHDFGANARRVQAFIDNLNAQSETK